MAWIKVAEDGMLQDDEVMAVKCHGRELAMYKYQDHYHVTDNVCSHQYALLAEGYFEDGCIECPLHQARFDIRTGKALCAPATKDIEVFEVKVEDGAVLVNMPQ